MDNNGLSMDTNGVNKENGKNKEEAELNMDGELIDEHELNQENGLKNGIGLKLANKLPMENGIEGEDTKNIESILQDFEQNPSISLFKANSRPGSKEGDNYMSVVKRVVAKGKFNDDQGLYESFFVFYTKLKTFEELFRVVLISKINKLITPQEPIETAQHTLLLVHFFKIKLRFIINTQNIHCSGKP